MAFTYDSAAARKAQFRRFRSRLDLADSPHLQEIEAAGARLAINCRADASGAIRDYIWRKKSALVRHWSARDPWRPIVNYGRELPLSMKGK